MSIGADGAEYCVKYWSIGAGVSIEYRFHTNPVSNPEARAMRPPPARPLPKAEPSARGSAPGDLCALTMCR